MAQIYLFTGENSYLLREEKKRWIQEFVKKHGEDSLVRLEGSSFTVRQLLDEVTVLPFLAERRLVIVEGVMKCTKDEIGILTAMIHPHVILLFVDPKPDKRSSGVKELLTIADTKQFPILKGKALAQWMEQFARGHHLRLEAPAMQTLMEYLGDNQDLLAQEIRKLGLFAAGRPITRMDIEEMTIPTDEGVIWRLTDLLCEGSRPKALAYALRSLERGGDAYGLWAILLSMLKNLVLVRAALDAGMKVPKDIAEKTGVHPFALRSLQSYAQRMKTADLQRFVRWVVAADRDLKTGGYRATDDAPQELDALIDGFILKSP